MKKSDSLTVSDLLNREVRIPLNEEVFAENRASKKVWKEEGELTILKWSNYLGKHGKRRIIRDREGD